MSVKVAAIQRAFSSNTAKNVKNAMEAIKEAASLDAKVILLPELFENIYFCAFEKEEFFSLAREFKDHPTLKKMSELARELGVVLPLSFFEKEGPLFYNSLAMIDADGKVLGRYRKSHIPDGPGYEEKFYFRPGDSGFRVFDTRYGKLGAAICWDQWFPECARALALKGADLLIYPTAIGTEPEEPELDTSGPWQRAMQGHAVCNTIPVIAANRWGQEERQNFYGHSFICDPRGEIIAQAPQNEDALISAEFDFEKIQLQRASFGLFRDRRPDLY